MVKNILLQLIFAVHESFKLHHPADRKAPIRVIDLPAWYGFSEPRSITLASDVIASDSDDNSDHVDGAQGFLIPGMIDAHVHLHSESHLRLLVNAGVTSALDMGAWPSDIAALREKIASQSKKGVGLPDIRSAGCVMTAPGASHSKFPGLPSDTIVNTPEEAIKFVTIRQTEGSDYIKLIADVPGPLQSCLDAAVREAKRLQLMTIIHACTYEAFRMALAARPSVITHVPMDRALTDEDAREMVKAGIASVPTLSMMSLSTKQGWHYANAASSVLTLYRCGVVIMAGSDAVDYPGAPDNRHGDSLLRELELLFEAGLNLPDVLKAATCYTADFFGLSDRGRIEPGKRADVVLLRENPSRNIQAFRQIMQIWSKGLTVK